MTFVEHNMINILTTAAVNFELSTGYPFLGASGDRPNDDREKEMPEALP